ncbi:MAG: hypothetical protein AB7L17_13025 [Ilumatobacteraceae bacterium]
MHRQTGTALCAAVLLTLMACSGGDDDSTDTSAVPTSVDQTGASTATTTVADGATTAPTAGGGSTSVPGSATTTAGGGTTVGEGSTDPSGTAAGTATTADPGPTNAVPQNDGDLKLLADGLGPLKFGAPTDDVVAAITAIVGEPVSDAPATYPIPIDGGLFQSEDEELGFVQPFGRTVCWLNGLCIENAGTEAGSYTFAGWYYAATGPDLLAAPSGLDVGSTWAEHESEITIEPGGCATVGHGTANGVSLNLLSSGEPFVDIDADGNETPGSPDPADVVVQQMEAGAQVEFLLDDC